jgi:Transglutaminase-like superfamily/Coenzyme PQQ synthesis protein D (PqqD)
MVPETVHAAPDGNGDLVLINQATGRWHKLNRTGSALYDVLRAGADLEQAVTALTERHPAIPADRIRGDVELLVATLVERGLLVLSDDTRRSASAVLMTAPDAGRAPRARHRVMAVVAFTLALVLLRLPFRVTTPVVTRLRGRLARRKATESEALAALAAAYWVSRSYPGRAACLEVSLTAVLTAALRGLRVDWCFGTAVDPQTFHAWIEVDGVPVTDASEDPIPPTYRRVLTV